MDNDAGTNAPSSSKDLLLKDYDYLSESFWKNEQIGETRVNFFMAIATAVIGGLVALINSNNGLKGTPLRLIIIAGHIVLLVVGLITLKRILMRNKATDEYKRGLDNIRQIFKDHFDPQGTLSYYYPVRSPGRKEKKKCKLYADLKKVRKFGGLAYYVAGMNALIAAGITAAIIYCAPSEDTLVKSKIENIDEVVSWPLITLVSAFIAQYFYVVIEDFYAQRKLRECEYTHSFGLVFKKETGVVKYLFVKPTKGGEKWVLPKGKIDANEGHGEAALREVYEETGVRAQIIGYVGSVEYVVNNENVRGKAYLMECVFEDVSKENRGPEWFRLEDMAEKQVWEETRYLLKVAERRRVALCSPGARRRGEHMEPLNAECPLG